MWLSKTDQTIRLTMAQAVVKYLQAQYSERDGKKQRLIPAMWGIFGHGNVAGLGQALAEVGTDLPFYQPHNEQSMVHTASGYAKSTLRLSTFVCTASVGPGSTNMITGAATATLNRLPVLLLASDYYATRHQGNVLQQLEHPISADLSVNDCFRPVSRFFDRISRPEQLLTALPTAMRVLTSPADTGAVTLALPQDIQAHAFDYPAYFFEERAWEVERRAPSPSKISQALEMIQAAERPMIIAGGGVLYSDACAELQAFAEKFGIPVGETMAGKGAMPDETSMRIGGYGVTGTGSGGTLMAQADLVISIGTRLTDFTTGSQSAFQHPNVKFIGINVSDHDAYKQGALPILADAREALRALLSESESMQYLPNSAYLEDIAVTKQEWEEMLAKEVYVQHEGEIFNQHHAINVINKQTQPGDTIVAAAGGLPGDLHQLWDNTDNRTCHLEFGNSCMGYELPASLGVRMAQPEGEVYCCVGDGTFLMQPTELVTAMQEGLKVTVIVMVNHGFQIIRRLQMGRSGVSFGNEFRARDEVSNRLEGEYVPVDFAKIGEGMGAKTWSVTDPDDLKQALAEARQESGPCLIQVEVEPHRYGPGSEVWWDVASAEVTNVQETQDLRDAYVAERSGVQRFHY